MSAADGDESSEDDVNEMGAAGRVVMMYDESGNAVPMPMGNFYYDTYKPPEEDESDEESDDKHASDTECAHKPAAFSMGVNSESDKEGSEEYESQSDDDDQFMRIQVAAAPLKAANKIRQDIDHDKPKPSRSSVSGRGGRASLGGISGMKRAMSSVKLPTVGGSGGSSGGVASSNDSARPNPVSAKEKAAAAKVAMKVGNGRQGIGNMGRLLSFTKEKKQQQSSFPQSKSPHPAEIPSIDVEKMDRVSVTRDGKGQDRDFKKEGSENNGPSKPQKRQGIAAVGRLLSISKWKEDVEPADIISVDSPVTVAAGDESAESSDGVGVNRDFSSPGTDRNKQNSGVGRIRAKGASVPRRPGTQGAGRMASFSRKVPGEESKSERTGKDSSGGHISSGNRERRETEKSGAGLGNRIGVKQVGRMFSMSRKPAAPPAGAASSASPSSTRSKEGDRSSGSVMSNDRDRRPTDQGLGGANAAAKKEARMSLKAAGRMLSFSRKPVNDKSKLVESSGTETSESVVKSSAPVIKVNPPAESSPKLDGRANKFFFSEVRSTVCKSSSLFTNETHIRVPILVLAEYSGPVSKNKWFIDAFTLPHNAVRRECIDMYDIIMALARCSPDADVTRDDMRDFHSWWTTTEQFLKCYFDMEHEVLFPWVDAAGSRDWELQMALGKMRTMKDGLRAQLDDVSKAWQGLQSQSVGDLYCTIYKAIDIFCPRIMNYFSDQELLLPQIVKGFYRIEDRLAMDKDMLAVYIGDTLTRKNKDLAHHNVVLLVRWMSNPRQLRAWIAKNLNSTGRSSYGRWHALYESEHSRYVKAFRSR